MKKNILLLSFALLTISGVKAQTVNYSINYNNPDSVRPLKVGIIPLSFDLGGGIFLSGGLYGEYILGKVATFDVLYKKSYFNITGAAIDVNKSVTTIPTGGSSYFELGGIWHFSDRLVNRKLSVNLSTEHSGGKTYSTNMKIPVKARKIYGIHAGIFRYANLISATSSATYKVKFQSAKDTTAYRDNATTHASSTGIFAGLCTQRIDKAGVAVDGYGNRRRNRNRILFADAMFGATNIQDITLIKSNTKVDISKTPTTAIGWRVGGQWLDGSTMTRMEIGNRPFVTGGNFYLAFTFGFTLYGNEKKMKKMKNVDRK